MSLDLLFTLLIEVLFTIVFVAVLVDYLRRRDPLSRDLVGVFGSLAALFVVQFIGLVFGATPPWLAVASGLLIFAQPLFALRLTARLRSIPQFVLAAAVIGYLATAVPLFFLPPPLPLALTLSAIGVFAVTEFLAAGYLAAEGRKRTGAARFRLVVAAGATALFALAILTAGAGAAGAGDVGAVLARIAAFLAALGYAIAFLPSGPLGRVWQGMAAYRYVLAMLEVGQDAPGDDKSAAIWHRFAEIAREIGSADAAAIVSLDEPECRLLATSGFKVDA
jgi:hypothetical protein